MHYPTLECEIQGFHAMRFSEQRTPRFQDFPVIWLAAPLEANLAYVGISYLVGHSLGKTPHPCGYAIGVMYDETSIKNVTIICAKEHTLEGLADGVIL